MVMSAEVSGKAMGERQKAASKLDILFKFLFMFGEVLRCKRSAIRRDSYATPHDPPLKRTCELEFRIIRANHPCSRGTLPPAHTRTTKFVQKMTRL